MAESLTAQQRAAIETRDVSVALSAGAGCGKTFVLTRRFLSYLEPGTLPSGNGTGEETNSGERQSDLGSLVAITFTERAAREMRKRIREECALRLETCSAADVPHWMRLVRELDSARIDTIHSFCGSLLRSNAVEAELDPNFALLDEMRGSALLRRSVELVVRARLAVRDADMSELVYEFGLDRTAQILESLVLQRFRIEPERWKDTAPTDLAERWTKSWTQVAIPLLMQQFVESKDVVTVLALLAKHKPSHPKACERWAALNELLPRLGQVPGDPVDLLTQVNEAAKVQGLKSTIFDPAAQPEEIYAQVKEAFESLRKSAQKVQEKLPVEAEHVVRSAEIGLCALRAVHAAIEEYERQKQAVACLDFDDMLLRARNLLRDHPRVRQRAAAGISLLMVDEFQDTDPVQTEIVRMLCGEQLLHGRLFLVGDHKQSIYRFRRAEPRVFHELRQEIPEGGRLPLSQNFRSQPAILNFVNVMFEDVLKPDYEPLVPSFEQLTPEPAIEFLFSIAEETVKENPVSENTEEGEGADDESPAPSRLQEARWIARRLHALLHDGVPRIRHFNKEENRVELLPVQPHDCVLLFRAMSDVRYYEAALREYGLDYYVVGGQAFYAQQEVYDVVNLCHFLDDPNDQIALLGLLRSPFFSVSDDGIYAMVREYGSLVDALGMPSPAYLNDGERQQIAHAGTVLKELREQKDRLSLVHLLELAISRTGYDAALLVEFLGPRKLANLQKLLEMARQFDRAGLLTLSDFVEQLRSAVVDEAREPLAATHPESSNVIRLMTIHQAKGLEFPVVVVVDMDRRPNDQPPTAVYEPTLGPLVRLPDKFGVKRENLGFKLYKLQEDAESLQELYRMLYVATTRAASMLLLSAQMKRLDRPQSPWMKLLLQKFNVETGQPRQDVLVKHSRDCPQILIHHQEPLCAPQSGQASGQVGLESLRDSIMDATPEPLPMSCDRVPVDSSALCRFSVSQIEVADEALRPLPASGGQLFAMHDPAIGKFMVTVHPAVAPIVELPRLAGREPEFLGTLVHGVLERLDFSRPPEIDGLVEAVILSLELDVSEVVRDAARHCVRELLASPLAKELAEAKQCHRELEFLLHWPQGSETRTIAGTIDCLYETAQGRWILFDYKTRTLAGHDEAADTLVHYEIQLGIYCLAVRHMLQRLPDRVELVLVRNGIQRVWFEPTDEFVQGIARRVGAALAYLVEQALVCAE